MSYHNSQRNTVNMWMRVYIRIFTYGYGWYFSAKRRTGRWCMNLKLMSSIMQWERLDLLEPYVTTQTISKLKWSELECKFTNAKTILVIIDRGIFFKLDFPLAHLLLYNFFQLFGREGVGRSTSSRQSKTRQRTCMHRIATEVYTLCVTHLISSSHQNSSSSTQEVLGPGTWW